MHLYHLFFLKQFALQQSELDNTANSFPHWTPAFCSLKGQYCQVHSELVSSINLEFVKLN